VAGEGRIEVSEHDYEAEAQTIADASREPHALIDSVKLEAAFIAAYQRGYQRGLRDAREACRAAERAWGSDAEGRSEPEFGRMLAGECALRQLGGAIDALIAKETP
jgi:hypothetical protein